MKSLYKIFLVSLFLAGLKLSAALPCVPLPAPTLLSQSISSPSLVLNWQSNSPFTTYSCQNIIEVEIACFANAFGGASYALFNSAMITVTVSSQAYPSQWIDMLGWCPGVYKFRARERNLALPGSPGAWSSIFTFTIPGTFNPPIINLQSSNINFCPPQSTTLTANIIVDCGFPPYTYSWSLTGLSCITCSNPIVSPTVTTTYTAWVGGGQLSCWTASATITVYVGPIPPVIGPASAFPPAVCTGSTTIVGLAFYNGNVIWQASPTGTGTWTNIPNGNGYNFVSPPLTTTIYYRALVQGCLSVDSSNVVQIIVNQTPTVTVPNVLVCPGQTATMTASGASSYLWSTGAFPTGINTGGAQPPTTTNYTVEGVTAGCTNSTVVTVSVGTTPLAAVSDQTVCFNQNINLTASGGTGYAWQGPLGFNSNIQSPVIPNGVTSMSGPYTVVVTSAIGCTNSAISNITVLSVITPTIDSNNPVCFGASINFTARGANTYTWTGPNSFGTNNPAPVLNNISYSDGGIYNLVGAVGTCSGSTAVLIIVKTPPSPTAQNTSPVCDGFPVSFTATGGVTYTWTGPTGYLSTAQNPIVANMYITNAGGYTLYATGTNSCVASVVSNVTVNPLPIIPATNLTVCLNSPVNLTSGGGATYSWTGPNGFTSLSQNPSIPNSTYSRSGQYSVSVVTAAGCSNTAVTDVLVIAIPFPTITSVSSICVGSTLSLQGSGGITYLWNGPNNFTSNSANPSINGIGILSDGIYTLTAYSAFCAGVITKSINVMPLPVVSIPNKTVCETKSLVLMAIGGVTNQWYTPGGVYALQTTFTIPYMAPSMAGNYTVSVTGLNGCVTTTVFPVAVLPNPTVTASGATVCAGQPAVLTSTGGVTYQWTGPGFNANTANATIPVVNNNTIGTYTVTVGAVNSCSVGVPVDVGLIAIPEPTIIVTPTVCFNSQVSLDAIGGISYRWDGPFEFLSTKQTTTFTASSMGLSGTYTLSAFNISGCVGYTTTPITIFPMPEGLFKSDNQAHCVPFCSEFSFASKYTIPVTNTTWYVNNTTFSGPTFRYCFFEPGSYLVTGNFGDANGCANTSTFLINAHETPRADFSFFPDKPVEIVDEVEFRNGSVGNHITKWSWSFINNNGYKSENENTSYYFPEAGNYAVSLVVKNIWNCADTMIKPLVIEEDFMIFVPTAFTPNEDGRNEIFQPKGRGVVKYLLLIHDRWGEKVFETKEFSEGWDGSFRGKPCKEETYTWKILAYDRTGKVKDIWGHVTLYR